MNLINLIPIVARFKFLKYKTIAFIFSAFLVVASIFFVATKGIHFGIDFSGGIDVEIKTNGTTDINSLRSQLKDLKPELQSMSDQGDVISIRLAADGQDEAAQMARLKELKDRLGTQVEYRNVEVVGPKVGGELVQSGIYAVVFALLAIALYIWLRFEMSFAVGALVALAHDMIVTVGFYSVTQLEFSLTTLAAMLTIAGYSINDTVVSYDRVRENLNKFRKKEIPELLDQSINETFSRTILTSFTTLIAVLAITLFGGVVLQNFSIAILLGIFIGTYSSVYIAVPALLYFDIRD